MQQKLASNYTAHKLEPFIFLYITEKCQLRCKHCYMGDRLQQERYMSVELVTEILRAMRILYGHYKVYILGGEPTLHPQLNAILEVCKDEQYSVVITSNGLFSPKKWHQLSRDYIDSFSFSLDGGTKDVHEFTRGKNTFTPLNENIRESVRRGFQTRLIYTVNTHNIHDVNNALLLAEYLGVNMISFHYFTPTGIGQNSPELQVSPREWIDFCRWLRERSLSSKVHVYYPPAFVEEKDLVQVVEKGYRGCTARNLERLAFFPDGRCYTCSAFFDTELHYGEFSDGRIVPRVNIDGINELKLVNQVSVNCVTCHNSTFCRGGCAAYDYFEHTLVSNNCERNIVPICPLWSCSANSSNAPVKIQELR